jgi:hypothetical protein
MKRTLAAVYLILLVTPAYAFDPTPGRERVGVLRPGDSFTPGAAAIEKTLHDTLCAELRARGFEVLDVEQTFDDLAMDPDRDADWYVELVPAHAESADYGGVGVGGRHADVTLGVVVSRIAAEVRVYRGRTLELLATESLAKRNTALLPTSIGVGGSHIFAALALPFVTRAQERSVARAAGRDLASRITAAIRSN